MENRLPMSKPHYYLKDKNPSEEILIVLRWQINKKRFSYSTGEKVRLSLWSTKKERVLNRHPFAQVINSKLDRIERAAREQYEILAAKSGYVSFDELRESISIATAKQKSGNSFFDYFYGPFTKWKENTPGFSNSSIKPYNSGVANLRKFCDFKKMEDLDFSEINGRLWKEVEEYLLKRGFANSYIRKNLSKIRSVIRRAVSEGVAKRIQVDDLKTQTEEGQSTEIALDEDELKSLYDLDLRDDKRLERVRDVFICACKTGLRYSDFNKINRDHIQSVRGYTFLVVLPQKSRSGKLAYIPMSSTLNEILDKYGGSLPVISGQKMNDYIKEVAAICEPLQTEINRVRFIGGKMDSDRVPKWTMVSTHTGRRTFATNAYLSGMPTIQIRSITGHSSDEMLEKYIRATSQQMALRAAALMASNELTEAQKILEAINVAMTLPELDDEDIIALRRIAEKLR
ncbi:MAG: phage integrase SAM-like domain-containing protein [Thiotrichales bacterium]